MSQLHRPRPPSALNESVRSSARSVSAHRTRNLKASNEFRMINPEHNSKHENARLQKTNPSPGRFMKPAREKSTQFFLYNNRIVEKKPSVDHDPNWDFPLYNNFLKICYSTNQIEKNQSEPLLPRRTENRKERLRRNAQRRTRNL